MTKIIQKEGKELYQCEECGFHYEDKKQAEKCQVWCKEHHSCNIEIIASAIENKSRKDTQDMSGAVNRVKLV